jgi:hypothetical protein
MIGTTRKVFDIQPISAVQPSNGSLAITFQSGLVTWLPPNHPDREMILQEAEWSRQQHRPVGVMADEQGRLLELSHVYDTCVDSVREDEEDKSRLAVWCWDFSPACYLTRAHPDFDRIRATLEQAAASGGRVWLANRMRMVEGETEVWWQILDVRPVAAAPSGA